MQENLELREQLRLMERRLAALTKVSGRRAGTRRTDRTD
jgi:hypothetical protein